MREVTKTVYTIDTHPEPEKCFEWIRDNLNYLSEHVLFDGLDSIKELHKAVGGELDYSISVVPDRGEFVKLVGYDEKELERLFTIAGDCPLTGFCYDITVIEGLYKGALENDLLTMIHSEHDYIYSDEALREMCEVNEYEFNENGSIY